ncbi:hypothetical protein [Thiohalomonas denitrificans]|uniref:Uncharacterized protein n=1 Tax=Thiohalomonas denitrificans TaxID=415747 RepID=A0A1G5Q942_9GAMM|nr:hypothetical protein [Thiohalomonas denitrificans]SCZ58363.1 hypothetical protein SAMN03097708_01674 [Thiohalomonas denitrificans]
MTRLLNPFALMLLLLSLLLLLPSTGAYAGAPGATEIDGQKVLTLVGRDPPGLRCNNNMQVAAELSNVYKIPVQLIPVTFAGPGAKAPAVYYGDELIAADGGNLNGMIDFTTLADILELEGVPLQDQGGRLTEIKSEFEKLKQAIKTVQ